MQRASPSGKVHAGVPADAAGKGTKGGPYTGFASPSWLQTEVKKDVDDLRTHVDTYATKREQKTFEKERSALQAQITHLNSQLADSKDKTAKLELMLPNDNGEFRKLRQELHELEEDCDHFCDLYEREAKARKQAQAGIKTALGHLDEIEHEFDSIKQLLDQIPAAAAAGAMAGPATLATVHAQQLHHQGAGPQLVTGLAGGAGPGVSGAGGATQHSAAYAIAPRDRPPVLYRMFPWCFKGAS